ncbi:MAG: glycogen synthase [Clostridia bacterium]|nr:glycogen synthase [Clostridia bacterium]
MPCESGERYGILKGPIGSENRLRKRGRSKMAERTETRVAFIGSECYPFVKTGGLGDVMYALPRALVREGQEVRVILPLYSCIPAKYKEQMVWKGSFMMDLTQDGRSFFVGVMELEKDGVVYDFIENKEFFDWGNPYTGLWEDIPKYCYFAKASLAALNFLEWTPDVVHCHDWQAALVPVYLRTRFALTPVGAARSVLTIHNLRFQGICSIEHLKYWTGLQDDLFTYDVFLVNDNEANMFKGGLAYADRVTTVSETYAQEIQTDFYGEGLNGHLWYHRAKLRGIVNGIDVEQWDPQADQLLPVSYGREEILSRKGENKRALQRRLGLQEDEGKLLLGLVSRLTDQKGLDLVDAVFEQMLDENTQIIVLGTGDPRYENAFRYFESVHKGQVSACIMYDESLSHQIYGGVDALLVPSLFEPCGLTQLIAMRYGTVPIVRETGGLKDTVEPYNEYTGEGNGFTFDRYEADLLLDAVRRAREVYFQHRDRWNAVVQRDMDKDVSWTHSARQYLELYHELKG